ncbi:MAG TPA: hypothetical protein VKK79_03725 [Candidatus Lokiarchaeia archaeon]|nr:hypothetical protein [Candidatus Lokiarchaeia archaeon]
MGTKSWQVIVVDGIYLARISPHFKLARQSFTRNELAIQGSAGPADAHLFRATASDCTELRANFARGAGFWEDFKG